MKRAVLFLFGLAVIAALGFLAWRFADERSFASTPYGEGSRIVMVPPGTGPRALARLLADARVVSDANRFFTHLHWFRRDAKTKAGEYQFDGALLPDEVLGKMVRGDVKTYRFTVVEGLRADEMAPIVAATGLCQAPDFLKIVRDAASPQKFGVPGPSLEGYLFPDTYALPRGNGCLSIVQTMVARFRKAWQRADSQRLDSVDLEERQAVTLASIIEKETGRPEERPRISCVFHNRLKKGMRLQTDPTVVYALLLSHDFRWDHNIHKGDLSLQHPYNTYVIKGLPPGPIASPGQAALDAALHPSSCDDLFFVSRNDHTHVFCPDLKCHEQNVRKFQVDYFQRKRSPRRGRHHQATAAR
ncbi:MAG TPA: endolytic transglycosylase MltG [Myxococcales bacterium]|nr:endolytic transglycosylase MltG [Myxococcales bacterium]